MIATDEMEKCTDVRVLLPQLSGVTAAGTENRMGKVLVSEPDLARGGGGGSGELAYIRI